MSEWVSLALTPPLDIILVWVLLCFICAFGIESLFRACDHESNGYTTIKTLLAHSRRAARLLTAFSLLLFRIAPTRFSSSTAYYSNENPQFYLKTASIQPILMEYVQQLHWLMVSDLVWWQWMNSSCIKTTRFSPPPFFSRSFDLYATLGVSIVVVQSNPRKKEDGYKDECVLI